MDMEEVELMIKDCLSRKRKLSSWEENFLFSIVEKEKLNKRQYEVLNKIWDKVTD